jgi:hypothetical protein
MIDQRLGGENQTKVALLIGWELFLTLMTECQRLDGAHTIIPGMLIAIRYTSQEISSKKKALPLTRCCRFDTLTRETLWCQAARNFSAQGLFLKQGACIKLEFSCFESNFRRTPPSTAIPCNYWKLETEQLMSKFGGSQRRIYNM